MSNKTYKFKLNSLYSHTKSDQIAFEINFGTHQRVNRYSNDKSLKLFDQKKQSLAILLIPF